MTHVCGRALDNLYRNMTQFLKIEHLILLFFLFSESVTRKECE